MAYFLGCDVSKLKLDLCLVDERGRQVWADTVPNEEADIAACLLTVAGSYPDLVCVAEATSKSRLRSGARRPTKPTPS
jgi:hypothetical protein